jgi:hypothetical protein
VSRAGGGQGRGALPGPRPGSLAAWWPKAAHTWLRRRLPGWCATPARAHAPRRSPPCILGAALPHCPPGLHLRCRFTAACSRPLILKQCLQLPVPLWRELLQLMGGEYLAAAGAAQEGAE